MIEHETFKDPNEFFFFWKVAKYTYLSDVDHWVSTYQPTMNYNIEWV